MSQIDEAFIQAYQTPPWAAPPRPAVQQPSKLAPEPVPAPHFQSVAFEAVAVAAPPQFATQASTVTPAEPLNERRPLSSFSAPAQPATTAFNPVFEVDAFRWPQLTEDLLAAHHQLLMPVAERLVDVSEQGRSLIGIAGTRPGIGCTTVQLCLARLIASAGKAVALVDGNFAKAGLARDLGLEFDMGWEQVLTGELPLAECVVKSIEDRMALLPLARRTAAATELLASIQTSVTAGVLRYHYDVVLFNLGTAGQAPQHAAAASILQHCRLDANLIVAPSATIGSEDSEQINPLLSLFGTTCLGVIGNTTA